MRARNKKVYGIGTNDADYVVSGRDGDGVQWTCPFYLRWRNMLGRCYSESALKRRKTYMECSVCPEWHSFMNFKMWMEKQDWKDKQLDKDLLFPNNLVYSPKTCVFIPQSLNTLLIDRGSDRGEYPLGVCKVKHTTDAYRAEVTVAGVQTYLGMYSTPEQAHKTWQQAKAKLINKAALEQTDYRIRDALMLRVKQLEDDIANSRETVKL